LFQENNCNAPHGIAHRPKKNGSVSETFARVLLGGFATSPIKKMATPSANINPKLREERKAAENAKAILGTLTPFGRCSG
jgi:hypothetical protein